MVTQRLSDSPKVDVASGWEAALRRWAQEALENGQSDLLSYALPSMERILIDTALAKTGGRRQDAARVLGWGRNTLTRKLKDLGMS